MRPYRVFKRFLDIALSVLLLLALGPLLLVIAFIVRRTIGRPALFRQRRPGYLARPFVLLKFRTMTPAQDGHGNVLPDGERLTPFGRILRSTSLDEVPGLINVLRGDMSLVGPRPLLMQYLDRYTAEQMRRHEVKPGITGWAQVNGRNAITWEDKFRLDIWYVDNWSLRLDLKILALTVWRVFRREGINQPGRPTADEFRGSPSMNR